MRVLLVTEWNRRAGGAEAHIRALRDGLCAAGDEVRLLTSSAGTSGDGTADYVAFGTERLAAQVVLQLANPHAVATVRRARREFRPDVAWVNMFAHHLSPAILFALGPVPFVLMVSDYKYVCPTLIKLLPDGSLCDRAAGLACWRAGCVGLFHWLRDRPRYALMRAGVARARRVLACGDTVRRELAAAGIAADLLHPPVPAPGAGFRRVPSPTPVFVFCGRLDWSKGASLLLRAFARLRRGCPAARLRVVGDGPERPALEREAAAAGLSGAVSFLGWLEPAAVEAQLADAWALVAPSLWAEPFGLVAPEAIVRGVPVVASAIGGFSETVTDGVTGLLFRNNDEQDLHRCLALIARRQVFPDHVLAADLVLGATEAFSIRRHLQRVRAILADLVASSPSSAMPRAGGG